MSEKKADSTVWLLPLVPEHDFSVQFRDDHVHIELSKGFKGDPEHREALWSVVRDACERHNSRRVLVEGYHSSGERNTADVIDAGQRTATVPNLWLAFCLSDFQPNEQSELYERIAASRGVRVKFFSDTESALKWLRGNSPR